MRINHAHALALGSRQCEHFYEHLDLWCMFGLNMSGECGHVDICSDRTLIRRGMSAKNHKSVEAIFRQRVVLCIIIQIYALWQSVSMQIYLNSAVHERMYHTPN